MGLKNLKSKVVSFFKKIPSKDEVTAGIKKSEEKIKDEVGEKLHLKKKDDGSSTQATYEPGNYSVFDDPGIPWFRRWWMFAFLYPVVISFLLEWMRTSV